MMFNELNERLALRRNANFSTLPSITRKRFGNALNEAHRQILRMPGMERLRQTTTTTASVAGTQSYTVTSCARINRIWETTNDRKLEMKSLAWLRESDPDPQQGTPCVWIPTDVIGTSQSFLLWPTPSAVITYTLDILSAVEDLAADDSEPLLPDDFHDLLIDKAELKETKKADDPNRYAMLVSEIRRAESELKTWLAAHPDWRPEPTETRISRLGAWYPADTVIG